MNCGTQGQIRKHACLIRNQGCYLNMPGWMTVWPTSSSSSLFLSEAWGVVPCNRSLLGFLHMPSTLSTFLALLFRASCLHVRVALCEMGEYQYITPESWRHSSLTESAALMKSSEIRRSRCSRHHIGTQESTHWSSLSSYLVFLLCPSPIQVNIRCVFYFNRAWPHSWLPPVTS